MSNLILFNSTGRPSPVFNLKMRAFSFSIQASGINSPNGSLEVCYDERGHEYKIPTFCFSSSPDLIVAKPTSALTVEREEEEKCVRKGPPGAPLHLKVKINPGDHLLLIDTFENDTIAMLKQKIHEKSTEVRVVPL